MRVRRASQLAPASTLVLGLQTQAPRAPDGVAEQQLGLRIERAQFVLGPTLEGVVQARINPQQEGLALAHGFAGQ